MLTIFRHSLSRFRGQILGWGISLALIGAYLVSFYDSFMNPAVRKQYEQLLASFPKELFAFFGGISNLFTTGGYLNIEYFSYMPVILGIFAVLAGSGLLASDEENGTLDLVLAHPISRASIFFGRLLAFVVASLAILFLAWVGFVVVVPSSSIGLSALELILPFLTLFALLMLFGALALMLSMLLPSRGLAAMAGGILLVGSYFLTSLASLDKNLEKAEKFSPLHYYQGGYAVGGLKWEWFLGLLVVATLFALLAWWRFERRDVRVGGEGTWRFPALSLLHKKV